MSKQVTISAKAGFELRRCDNLLAAIDAAWDEPGSWVTEGPTLPSTGYPAWYSIRVANPLVGQGAEP